MTFLDRLDAITREHWIATICGLLLGFVIGAIEGFGLFVYLAAGAP